MGAFIFSEAAGKFVRYAELPESADKLVWVILASSGLEADATLRDYNTLALILAGANDEATFTGYSRQDASGVSVSDDDANNAQDVDVTSDPQWSPTTAEAIGKILLCYYPVASPADDTTVIPLFADDFAFTTPTSGTITYQVASGGFATAVAN